MGDIDDTNTLLSYSPGDFFYVKANENGTMPSPDQCTDMDVYAKTWDISCNEKNYSENAEQCFKKELCKNKEKVEWIKNVDTRNSGSTRKYLDVNQKYNTEYLNTVNLGIGIIIVTAVIIKNTYNNI